jgi:hypothetical protein
MNHPQTTTFVGTATASAWWMVDALMRHGPGWQLMPPLLIGMASVIGATRGMLNDLAANRRADELHRIELARLKAQ